MELASLVSRADPRPRLTPRIAPWYCAMVITRRELSLRFRGLPLTLLAAVVLTAGCDEAQFVGPDPWPEDVLLDGFWEGVITDGRFEMTLTHAPDDRLVTGVGAWIPRAGSRAFRVEGVVTEETGIVTFLLEMSPSGPTHGLAPVLVQYRARLRGPNELRGRLNGGGFDDTVLVLRRTRAPRII